MDNENTPKKQYYVHIPGTKQGQWWYEDRYERNKDKLFEKYPETEVTEKTPFSANQDETIGENDQFDVYIPGTENSQIWDGARLSRNYDALLEKYPGTQISRVKNVDYFGDQLRDLEQQKATLKQQRDELKAQNEARNTDKAEQVEGNEAQIRENLKVLDVLDKDIEDLNKRIYNNPAYQRNEKEAIARNDSQIQLMSDKLAALDKANPDATKHQTTVQELAKNPFSGVHIGEESLGASVADRMENPDYYRDHDALVAAQMYYQDALKTQKAPSRYDDSKTGFGNFFRGMVGQAPETLSLVSLAKAVGEGAPLIKAVKMIQDAEGKNANIVDLIYNHPEQMGYLSDAQKELVKAFCVKSATDWKRSEDLSLGYQAGASAMQSLGYMADFAIMGGIGNKAADVATKGLTKAIAKKSVDWGLKGATREIALAPAKFLEGTVKSVIKTAVMTPFMPSSYANFVNGLTSLDPDTGTVDLSGKAIFNQIGDTFIENFSESAGTQVEGILGFVPKVVGKTGWGKAVANTPFLAWGKALTNAPVAKLMKQAGWNGYVGEIGEEWYGNLLRVMTGVDKDALKNFATKDQQLITLASFAPMSILGGGTSMAQFGMAKRDMSTRGKALSEMMYRLGYNKDDVDDRKAVQDLLDITKCENPTELAEHFAPVLKQAEKDDLPDYPQLYKAVADYVEAVARYRTFDGVMQADGENLRKEMLDKLNQRAGRDIVRRKKATIGDGSEMELQTIRAIEDADGQTKFVVSEDETLLAVIDRDGNTSYIPKATLEQGIADKTMTDTGEMRVDDYLDMEIARRKRSDEQTRMTTEVTNQRASVRAKIEKDGQLNIGTAEEPKMAAVTRIDDNGIVVENPDPDAQESILSFTWEEVAEKLGQPIGSQTDEQKEEQAVSELENRKRLREGMRNVPAGTKLHYNSPQPDGSVKPLEVEYTGQTLLDDEGNLMIGIKDGVAEGFQRAESFNSDELEALISSAGSQQTEQAADSAAETPEQGSTAGNEQPAAETPAQTGEAAPVVDPEEEQLKKKLLDFRGNKLPTITKDGEPVVDQATLWDKDPEAWAHWNDEQRQDGGANSVQYFNTAIKSLQKTIKEAEKTYAATLDFDKRDTLEDSIKAYKERLAQLQSILDGYAKAAEAQADAEKEVKKAEEKTNAEAEKEQKQDEEIKPIGRGSFGDIYDAFKGKAKEAFDFLLKKKSGYLVGVFHRDEIGDIDLAYGEAPNPYKGKGLAHIIKKHVETLKDFDSVEDAINTISDVIETGEVKTGTIANTYDIEKGDYRVVVAADEDGNWVLTAFDYVNSAKEKKKGTATNLTLSQSSDEAGAVASNLSEDKVTNNSETSNNQEVNSSEEEKKQAFDAMKSAVTELYNSYDTATMTIEKSEERDRKIGLLYKEYREKYGDIEDLDKFRSDMRALYEEKYNEYMEYFSQHQEEAEKETKGVDTDKLRLNIAQWESAPSIDYMTDEYIAQYLTGYFYKPEIDNGLKRSLVAGLASRNARKDFMLDGAKQELASRLAAEQAKEQEAQKQESSAQQTPSTEQTSRSTDEMTPEEKWEWRLKEQGTIEGKAPRVTKPSVFKFTTADKKDPRAALHGVYHDGGYEVASDSYIIVGVRSQYDAALEGKITTDNGEEITATFPKWRAFLNKEAEPLTLDIKKLAAFVQGAKAKAKEQGTGLFSISFRDGKGNIVTYKGERLEKFINFALHYKCKVGVIDFVGKPLLSATNEDSSAFIRLMPVNGVGNFIYDEGQTQKPTVTEQVAKAEQETEQSQKQETEQNPKEEQSLTEQIAHLEEIKNNPGADKKLVQAEIDRLKAEQQEQATPKEYVYRLNLRPFGIGNQPEGGRHISDGSSYGAVVYDRPLSAEEVENFSLRPITEAKDLAGKKFEAPFGKGKIVYTITDVDDDGVISFTMNTGKGETEPQKATYYQLLNQHFRGKAKEVVESDVEQSRNASDSQGNPTNEDGTLKVDVINSIDELTDADFTEPTRNVQLPKLPQVVDDAIGAAGKPVVIKKNIFEKNRDSHKDLSPEQSREILTDALYTPDLYGQNQKTSRPYNWILIHNADKHSSIVLEVNHNKDNVEIVNWHYLDDDSLEQKKKQAIKEGGRILTLASAAGNTLNGLSSEGKDTNNSENSNNQKVKSSGKKKGSSKSEGRIEDSGEQIAGARKDMLRDIARTLDNATMQSLVELPFSKVFKRPDLRKMVENGTLREKDARFADAVIFAFLSTKKPVANTKQEQRLARYGRETKVQKWAKFSYQGIEILKALFEADESTRDAIMEKTLGFKHFGVEAAQKEQKDFERWNRGKTYDGICYPINPVLLFHDALERLGYPAGQKIEMPVVEVRSDSIYSSYDLLDKTRHRIGDAASYDSAVDNVVYLTKVANADEDTEHPRKAFRVKGEGKLWNVTGYRVRVAASLNKLQRDQYDLSQTFPTQEEAKKVADEYRAKGDCIVLGPDEVKQAAGYEKYGIYFVNPVTFDAIKLDREFDTEEEAKAAIDAERETLNAKANEKIAEEANEVGTKREDSWFHIVYYWDSIVDGKEARKGEWKYGIELDDRFTTTKSAMNTMPVVMADGFNTREEAQKELDKHKEEWKKYVQGIIDARRNHIYFGDENAARQGEDYRGGRNVTSDEFRDTFGFRGVQFGNWTDQDDRQAALNNAYDSFMDLAKVLGITPKAISLNGELGIAFGARGTGGANAHYESGEVVINLTKTRGAGSLAHEWWHALDNYFSRSAEVPMGFATDSKSIQLREEMRKAFNQLIDDVNKSDYHVRSKDRGASYWGTTIEETARLFAEWVGREMASRGERNPFLVRGIIPAEEYAKMNYNFYTWGVTSRNRRKKSEEKETVMGFEEFKKTPMAYKDYVYPTTDELETLGEDVRNIFDVMEERKDEDTGNVALFQVLSEALGIATPEQQLALDTVSQMLSDAGIEVEQLSDEAMTQMAERSEAQLMAFGESYDYDAYPRGRVEPNLESKEVQVVQADAEHGFKNFKDAKDWAKTNIAKTYDSEESGGKGNVLISKTAVDKFLSQSAVEKSESANIHFAVLKVLPEVLKTSIDVETHPDFKKDENGIRKPGNGYNKDVLVHRCYGAVNINGETYRVKITLKENVRTNETTGTHSHEATKIELLAGQHGDVAMTSPRNSNNSISATKLLKDVEMSYVSGKKVLDASRERGSIPQFMTVYHGSGAKFDAFDSSHMGEGEGAQAYGWGHYVTEVEGIGRTYAEKLRKETPQYECNGKELSYHQLQRELQRMLTNEDNIKWLYDDYFWYLRHEGPDPKGLRSVVNSRIQKLKGYVKQGYVGYEEYIPELEAIAALKIVDIYGKYGPTQHYNTNLYTVEIPNGKNKYLDWDSVIPQKQRKIVADYVRTLSESDFDKNNDNFDAEWFEDGWEGAADVIEENYFTAEELVSILENGVGSWQKVSEILSEAGFVGIRYPAGFFSGGYPDGSKNYVIFKDSDLKIIDRIEFLRDGDVVYGAAVGGKIYLNADKLNPNTPVHEYTHLWDKACRKTNPELWKRGVELMKQTSVWNEVASDPNYSHLDEDGIASEVHSRLSGKNGAQTLERLSSEAIEGNGSILDKAARASVISKLRKWLSEFWYWVKDTFTQWSSAEARNVSLEDFINMPLADLAKGTKVTEILSGEDDYTSFSIVNDKNEIDRLNSEPTIKVYRAMQLRDGKLYPPMAGKVNGEWQQGIAVEDLGKVWEKSDEHPELADDKGRFTLNKGNGTSLKARYNPYIHTSTTPLNDQFSSAQSRPELVTVEVEVPESELTSGYKADKAKDSVGKVEWKAGVVQGQLTGTRTVILSRWDKPVRIVPDSEVADVIVNMFDGKDITMPSNVVTPSLRVELEQRGIPFVETDNQGKPVESVDEIEQVNERFNEELQKQIEGTLPKEHIYQLGNPSSILLATEVPNLPIEMAASRLEEKASKYGHDFDLEEVRDLVKALQKPLAVFSYGDKNKAQNIIVPIQKNGKNFIVGLFLNPIVGGRSLEINSVRNIFPKDNAEWLNWITQDKALYLDKAKIQTLIDQQRTNLADVEYLDLDSVTKIVNNFVNPTQSAENEADEVIRYRRGEDEEIEPTNDKESLMAWQQTAEQTAQTLGVKVEIVTRDDMPEGHKSSRGVWQDGKIRICLENHRNAGDVIRTVLHEAVGHNGLRRLVGDERMDAFCMKVYHLADEQMRTEIANLAQKHGYKIAEATEEWLAAQVEQMDFSDKWTAFWLGVREALVSLLRKIGLADTHINIKDAQWLLWQSYNANKRSGLLNQAKRAYVANRLGFDINSLEVRARAQSVLRDRVVDRIAERSAAAAYNRSVNDWRNRFTETWTDMYQSVCDLVEAIEKHSGRVAKGFEDVRLALNQQSSKGLAAINKWSREYYKPMMNALKSIMDATGMKLKDIERYVMLKHAIERNRVFAKRDAVRDYEAVRDRKLREIENHEGWDDAVKEAAKNRVLRQHQAHLDAIDAETDSKYLEYRQKDYGGLTAFYTQQDDSIRESDFDTREEYLQARMDAAMQLFGSVDEMEREAQSEVDAFEQRAGQDRTGELWERINAATKSTLKHQYDANMLTKEQYEHVRDMFDYYVPLRGFAETEAEDLYSYWQSGRDGGFTAPLQAAKGRKTKAESPFGYIGAMASSAIAADMKNDSKLALYFFIRNRQDSAKGLVTVSDTWYEKISDTEVAPAYFPYNENLRSDEAKAAYDAWVKTMEEKEKAGLAFRSKDVFKLGYVVHISERNAPAHAIRLKVRGRDVTMYINGNPRAAQAINGELNIERSDDYRTIFGKILRWLSGINTSWNPEFWLSNMQRDTLFAVMAVSIKEDGDYNREFRKHLLHMLRTLNPTAKDGVHSLLKAMEKGELGDSRYEQYYREFVENGGVTGYTVIKDNDKWEAEAAKYVGEKKAYIKALASVGSAIQGFGESIEQMTRFAAFVTSREQGRDIYSAISDAKELTVNFNRKGSGKAITFEEAKKLTKENGEPLSWAAQKGLVMLSWLPAYGRRAVMFFNAAVQGLNAVYKLAKKNPAKFSAWVGGYFAMGFINAVLHSLIDDDDDYLDIPDYERRNNFLLGGGGVYFKWAMPQEARAFYAMGDMVYNHLAGRTPDKSLWKEGWEAFTDILPLNPSAGASALIPSALVPFFEAGLPGGMFGWEGTNKDYKGSSIWNDMKYLSDEEKKRTPNYQKAFDGTGKLYIDFAKLMNEISGGDYADAGFININPARVEHYVEGFGGGVLTTVNKVMKSTLGQLWGDDLQVRTTPFLSRLLTLPDERYRNAHTTEVFNWYKSEAEHFKTKYNKYRKQGDTDKIEELLNSRDYIIYNTYQQYKGVMKFYNDQLKLTDDKDERRELMREQDEYRKEMIKEISGK